MTDGVRSIAIAPFPFWCWLIVYSKKKKKRNDRCDDGGGVSDKGWRREVEVEVEVEDADGGGCHLTLTLTSVLSPCFTPAPVSAAVKSADSRATSFNCHLRASAFAAEQNGYKAHM